MIIKWVRLLFVSTLFVTPVVAQATTWDIVSKESSLHFTATQNNAPVTGEFKKFTGEVNFDADKLDASNVEIVVDTASVSTATAEVADTLKTSDWFSVSAFPQAIFKAEKFVKKGDNAYQANGQLTIRDKTVPVTLDFVFDKLTKEVAHVTGSTVLKRTQFGVGQGDWAKTDGVKDDVKVEFVVSAVVRK